MRELLKLKNKTFVHQILITDAKDIFTHLPKASQSIAKHFDKNHYEHKIWDNVAIRDFLAINFDREVLLAYDKLKPYAYKADLARYCIAYIFGGWYIDINIEIVSSPPSTQGFDMCLIRDYNNFTRVAPWQVANGLFYSVPKHPALLNAISRVVRHTQELYYGKRTLSVTGPELFGASIAEYGWDSDVNTNYLIGDFVDVKDSKRKQFMFNNKTFALHKTTAGGDTNIKGTNNYVEMWHNRDIYNR